MKKLLRTFVIATAALCVNLQAGSTVLMGSRPCGSWVKEKEQNIPRLAGGAWLTGYLSGLAFGSGKDVLRGADAASIKLWIDNYCQANPLDNVDDAANALFFELARRKGLL